MTQHIDATPETVTADIERVDFSAATLAELARFVDAIEAHWPLEALRTLTDRHRYSSDIDQLLDTRHGRPEPRYEPPENPTPIGPVLDALEGLDLSSFTAAHVDRIGTAVFAFGGPSTWRKLRHLTPNAVDT